MKFRKEQNDAKCWYSSGIKNEFIRVYQVIKFLLGNRIQRSVVDKILDSGLEALSLLDPEHIKFQKIPVGQRRLLVHVGKSRVIGKTSLQKADHGSQPTPSTSSSDIVHVQPVVEE